MGVENVENMEKMGWRSAKRCGLFGPYDFNTQQLAAFSFGHDHRLPVSKWVNCKCSNLQNLETNQDPPFLLTNISTSCDLTHQQTPQNKSSTNKKHKKNSSTPSKIINHLAEFLQSFPNFWKVRPSWESSPHPIPITRSHRLHPHEFQLFADVLRQLVDFALLQREVMALVIYRSYGNRPSFF